MEEILYDLVSSLGGDQTSFTSPNTSCEKVTSSVPTECESLHDNSKSTKSEAERHFQTLVYMEQKLFDLLERPLTPMTTIKSNIEKILEETSSALQKKNVWDRNCSHIKFAKRLYIKTIDTFHPFRGKPTCRNQQLWFIAQIKYSEILFETKEIRELEIMIQKLAPYFFNEDGHDCDRIKEDRFQAELVKIYLYSLKGDCRNLIKKYEKIKGQFYGKIVAPYTIGKIHEAAGEAYMSSKLKCYNKAYDSFLAALQLFSAMGSNAELRCLKWLFIIRMLQETTFGPFNDTARGVRLSTNNYPEILALNNLFRLYNKNDVVGFEDNLLNHDKDKSLKKYFRKVHTTLRKRILLIELPLRGTISLGALSEKLNGLDEGKVEKLVLALISEKKIDGVISHGSTSEYIGPQRPKPDSMQNVSDSTDEVPSFYVGESNHVLPIGLSAIESFPPNKDVDSSNPLQTFSQLETSDDRKACQDMLSAVATSMVAGFAKIIQEAREKYPSFAKHVDIVSADELIQSMTIFLNQQHSFKILNVSSFVDTGYHYTKPEFAASIRRNGLKCSENGFFGPGIYTGNYTKAFATYSKSVGLIVFRLQGKKSYSIGLHDVEGFVVDQCDRETPRENINTVIGNKARVNSQWPVDDYNDEIILQDPAQCLPVVIFDEPGCDIFGEECIGYIYKSLQDMADVNLNAGSTQASTDDLVETGAWYNPILRSLCYDRILRNDPSRTSPLVHNYNAPNNLGDIVLNSMGDIPQCKYDQKQECPICFEELGPTAHTLRSLSCTCVHIFHQDCIQKSLESSPRCPTCQSWVKEPQGKSPSGRMCLSVIPKKCCGYDEDTIQIHYQIYAAMQKPYHPHPNVRHSSKNVKAYIPNNAEGKNLLKRLKYAFEHGLTFTVGTSITTGLDHQCIWASIHHKTSLSGGTAKHGYPDPSYFFNCNEELNMLGVPPADVLPEVVLLDDKPWLY